MREQQTNTHGYVMKTGRHAGQLITRVPVNYLSWMVNVRHNEARIAAAELARRGTTTPEIDVSGHAIDRASQSCLDFWRKTRIDDEGLHAWLCRVAIEAHKNGNRLPSGKTSYQGMLFAIDETGCWPVLKTVIRDRGQNGGEKEMEGSE